MKLTNFEDLFLSFLSYIYHFENQLVTQIPTVAELAYSDDLRKALYRHLDETKEQVKRLDKIFQILKQQPRQLEWSNEVKNLFSMAMSFLKDNSPSPLLDSAIILLVQRIEHYEIATYGTLKEFADVLDYDEVYDLLKESLKEESTADKHLTNIAAGGAFKKGINVAAAH